VRISASRKSGYEEHACIHEVLNEKSKEQKRRRVGTVKVIDDEGQRLDTRYGPQEAPDGIEQSESGLLMSSRRRQRARQRRNELPNLRILGKKLLTDLSFWNRHDFAQ